MNIVNMPPYLTRAAVNQWMDRLEQSLDTFFGMNYDSSFLAELRRYTLEFSDDKPHFEDGKPISLDDAKTKLKDQLANRPGHAEDDKSIKRLIRHIEEAKTAEELKKYSSTIGEYCASGDTPEERSESCGEIEESILDLLGRTVAVGQRNRLYMLGCYFHSEKKIVLYVRAINLGGTAARLPLFEEVFAHEAFHAYHYYACEYASRDPHFQELPRRKDYTSRVVKESLAAFFELYYCGRNGIFTDIDNDWQTNPVYIYPYSGAKFLSLSGNGASASPLDVFEASLHDVDKALRLLLEADMKAFYGVKNVKERIVRTVTKKVPVTAAPSTLAATITDQEIDEALGTMGTGWFILKYAEEYRGMPSPIPLDYGDPKSFGIRMRTYKKNKPFHDEIIQYLKRENLDPRVRAGAGADIVRYRELQDILDRL